MGKVGLAKTRGLSGSLVQGGLGAGSSQRKYMAGVPRVGVLEVFSGVVETPNPTLVPGETLILKILPIFPICM